MSAIGQWEDYHPTIIQLGEYMKDAPFLPDLDKSKALHATNMRCGRAVYPIQTDDHRQQASPD